jgi:hypothetical protein
VRQRVSDFPFSAVFPDTNLFLPRWPEEPAGLAELLSVTGIFNIPVYLLQPVEIELEAHQLRSSKTAIENVRKACDKLPAPLKALVKLDAPNWNAFVADFRTRAAATKTRLELQSIDFPTLALPDLFNMAVNHEHPFREEGKNFQDAVIMRSVIEASQMKGLKRVAFVSKNTNDFDADSLRHQAQGQHVTLLFYKSLDELQQALSPFLEQVFKSLQERHSELAKQAVGLVMGVGGVSPRTIHSYRRHIFGDFKDRGRQNRLDATCSGSSGEDGHPFYYGCEVHNDDPCR